MTTVPSSSSSASKRRVNPQVPLITCPECEQFTVSELVVRTNENGNKGRIFYRCPGGKRGSGCQYYRWEENYLADLLAKEEEEQTKGQKEFAAEKNVDQARVSSLDLKINALVDLGKQVVLLLKIICLVCAFGVLWIGCVGSRN